MIQKLYRRTIARWREQQAAADNPPAVTPVQWVLASAPVLIALMSYEVETYAALALITQVLVGLNVVLLIIVTREVLKVRMIGKFCLVGGTFVFYWLDALTLSVQRNPFSISEGFPIMAAQFDQQLIQQALAYISIFQLLLLIGYSIRPRFDQALKFIAARTDSLSLDRTLIAFLLIMCSTAPLLIFYDFDVGRIMTALLASRSGYEFEAPEPSVAQHLALFGVYGAALFFVYALKTGTWQRFWWLVLGVIAAAPFILGGTRHVWLYISLPSVLILLRGVRGHLSQKRMVALTSAVVVILLVAQAQFVYRTVGWQGVLSVPRDQLSRLNTNGQLSALLFAEYLVPSHHEYFKEMAEPYFIIHWIPRQVWPTKPTMESWAFYNESYVEDGAFNVTPSVIGQFHLNWGLPGVMFIGIWLGFLTLLADRVLLLLNSDRQRAMFVVVGMFYAFIISSFRFYSPIYFSYFLFGVVAMFLLTRRRYQLAPAPFVSRRFGPEEA